MLRVDTHARLRVRRGLTAYANTFNQEMFFFCSVEKFVGIGIWHFGAINVVEIHIFH